MMIDEEDLMMNDDDMLVLLMVLLCSHLQQLREELDTVVHRLPSRD